MADRITVCVCTYRWNFLLARLLRNLAHQRRGGLFSAVVVDNDPDGPARSEVERLRSELPSQEILYGCGPEKSIPAARNHALPLAKGNYVGIIDDDEFPPPHWLITLYEAVRTFEVEGAFGPFIPFFEQPPPDWLIKSNLYDMPNFRTVALLQWGQTRTSNVLQKKSVVDQHGINFDEAFKTGGFDKVSFRQAIGQGYRFVAVSEAPACEVIPPERWTKSYFMQRARVNSFNARKYLAQGENREKRDFC